MCAPCSRRHSKRKRTTEKICKDQQKDTFISASWIYITQRTGCEKKTKKNWNATCKQWDLESSAYNKFSKRIDVYLGRHEILNRKKAKQEQKNYSLEIDVAIHSVFFLCWQAFLLSSAVIFIFLFNLFTAE